MPFALIFATSLIFSLLAKFLADAFLSERVALIGSFAGLQYSLNSGVAFGLDLGPVVQEVVIGLALALVLWIAWLSERTTLTSLGFGLILGGAVGNVLDRIPDGFVTDFIQIGTFPIFNIADSCITVGAFLLFFESFLAHRRQS